jgi:hypothetical protein
MCPCLTTRADQGQPRQMAPHTQPSLAALTPATYPGKKRSMCKRIRA